MRRTRRPSHDPEDDALLAEIGEEHQRVTEATQRALARHRRILAAAQQAEALIRESRRRRAE